MNSFLFVTANDHETDALLEDNVFFNYKKEQSRDQYDVLYYNVGSFGKYNVVHFQLPSQGSVETDASILSIHRAINFFKPVAVILCGIAFGKGSGQQIGDVLVSTKIADYESGKITKGVFEADGTISDSGRFLYSAFQENSKGWVHLIGNDRKYKANCEFGMILSGDKVVDDPIFKEKLFKYYPRAIGGEMEGRGAYAACRSNNVNELIIVKAICDLGDGNKSINKEENQIIASKSVVSLLKYIFADSNAFRKLLSADNNGTENRDFYFSHKIMSTKTEINTIWFSPRTEEIIIIISEDSEKPESASTLSENYAFISNIGDKDALFEVSIFLARHYPKAVIKKVLPREFNAREDQGKNLVIIGGPIHNKFYTVFSQKIRCNILYENWKIKQTKHNNVRGYESQYSEDTGMKVDYGCFSSFRNPYNDRNRVIMISGISSFGTLGAYYAFSDLSASKQNYCYAITAVQDNCQAIGFEALVKVNVHGCDTKDCTKVMIDCPILDNEKINIIT